MPLTPRELDVLTCLSQGDTNGEIAARLGIAVPTARDHVKHILTKLGARNRTAAAVLAVKAGLV